MLVLILYLAKIWNSLSLLIPLPDFMEQQEKIIKYRKIFVLIYGKYLLCVFH